MVVDSPCDLERRDYDGIAIAVGSVRHRRVAGTSIPSIGSCAFPSSTDRKGDRLALIVGHVAHATVAHVASRRRTYDRIQDAFGLGSPLYVLSLITVVVRAGANGFLAHGLVLAGGAEPASRLHCQRVGSQHVGISHPARSFRPAARNT
jgi:hypothetical protein